MKNEVKRGLGIDVADQINEPSLYQVMLHNDDFTPMAFVVNLLESFFYMTRRQATETMMIAHTKGSASCGAFSKDFAEMKMEQIMHYARQHEHPLACSMEAIK